MNNISLSTVCPVGCFVLATFLFFFALQQEPGLRRTTLAMLHILAVGFCLSTEPRVLALFPPIWVPFVIGVTVHTTSILLERKKAGFNLKVTIQLWSNIRRVRYHDGPSNPAKNDLLCRLLFGIRKTARVLALWIIDRKITELFIKQLLGSLNISIYDFGPHKQGLVPDFTYHDLILRGVLSVHWIWCTYFHLTSAHDLCAVLFVSVLRWDESSEWPPLYGPVTEAYSLRRFWGTFWHRLHVAPFAAYTPYFLTNTKALRTLWIFLLSAGCHTLMNLARHRQITIITEVRFFACNWAMCLLETMLGQAVERSSLNFGVCTRFMVVRWALQVIGYAFVWAFFMCTVPAWQYPLLYDSVMQKVSII